jgi:hypothetical protein
LFITHRSRFDRIWIRSRFLNRQFQAPRRLFRQHGEDCFPDNSVNPRINPAIALRHGGFVGNSHGILAVFLRAQRELVALDLFEVPAQQVVEHHILGSLYLAGCGPSSVRKPRSLAPAILLPGFHYAHEPANPIDLLTVRLAELLEPGDQVFRGLTF